MECLGVVLDAAQYAGMLILLKWPGQSSIPLPLFIDFLEHDQPQSEVTQVLLADVCRRH